ncbi:sugar ABC transporter substrate-binding protein [Candidatus Chlorohelix allophototropha]|uniref:Sugar ABC transporter substrate-binding protein n=2 Tax=Candidatus Chlorohelix allophototropha TaxID=3003348 RepID=A0ABY9AXJ5_9CHLR|nr:sugar ABC transporter substrate-binding protein [Chloroflexota bacterium L227-S17]
MNLTKSLYKKFGLGLAVVMGSAMMLGACGDNTATPVPAATTAAATTAAVATTASGATGAKADLSAAKGCKNVAILLPETDSSFRWEALDRPLLQQEIAAAIPGATIQYSNASNNADTQQNQAEAALTKGACILVVGAKDGDKASAIVQKAKAAKVPVIAYDRLIQDNDLAYYVSFDNVKVGELQGQWLADQYKAGNYGLKKGAKLAMINGGQTDNNALLFRQGALNKLKPLVDSGDLTLVYDQYTPDWDNAKAQTLMEGVLTAQKNDLQIAYVANDGMANTVIAALRAQKLNGKVPVTGQDASDDGIKNIITGDQGMTVYKAIPLEAKATGQLVAALAAGTDPGSIINGKTKTKGGVDVPSVLAVPVTVTKDNIVSTVFKDGFVKKENACKGLPAGTGGIC